MSGVRGATPLPLATGFAIARERAAEPMDVIVVEGFVGETVIGDNCIIEEDTSIFGSIVWNNTQIGRAARLVECVVGSECYLKDGSVIGAGVILSDDCVVEPGSVIEANSKIWPGNVVGDIIN